MTHKKGSTLDAQDKMQGVGPVQVNENHASSWKHECIYCGSKNLEVSALNISYRPHQITDFSNLPEEIRKYYMNLPTIVQAVMKNLDSKNDIMIGCLDCNISSTGFCNREGDVIVEKKPNKAKLRKYLNNFYGVNIVMKLGEDNNE